jgi:hypothetical protein
MSITSYTLDQTVTLGNYSLSGADAFTDRAGTATDPGTSVTMIVLKPSGASTIYTYSGSPALFKETTGRFYADVKLDEEGLWSVRLVGVGTAAVTAPAEFQVHVRKSLI